MSSINEVDAQQSVDSIGTQSSAFKMTLTAMGVSAFLASLFTLLEAFGILNLEQSQKLAIYGFVAAAWTFLPIAYTVMRGLIKRSELEVQRTAIIAQASVDAAEAQAETAMLMASDNSSSST
jgi:hypothetical protein